MGAVDVQAAQRMISQPRPVVVVVGSLHYDIMVEAPDRPRKGETVAGFAWRPKFGGKGGNQAVAAAQAGAEVRMAGAVGSDDFGRFLLEKLAAGGVDAARIVRLDRQGSGMSVAIIGFGRRLRRRHRFGGERRRSIPRHSKMPALWRDAGILVLQNEIAEGVNLAAAKAAKRVGAAVCLNAAPYRPLGERNSAGWSTYWSSMPSRPSNCAAARSTISPPLNAPPASWSTASQPSS